tara:strand:+ start:2642 stop:3046 length:405 start_codon:yes stop_codon:yes gene_type:complete
MAYTQKKHPFPVTSCGRRRKFAGTPGALKIYDESALKKRADKDSMPCNKPTASTKSNKKKMVKACEGGKERIVHFGEKGYGHNYSDAARKSFRARHKCGEKKTKLKAQYWACKTLWAGKGGSKKSSPKGVKGKY